MSKELENDEGLRVVPEAEVKEMFDGVKKDVAELTAQMTEDREKTGLDIEQRTDDFAKMAENVEAITDRLEKAERASQQNQFVAGFGQSSGELKDALDSFGGGFMEFNGDHAAKEMPEGSKPSLKNLIEGVFTKTAEDDNETQFHAPQHIAIRRLQKASDTVLQVDAMMRAQKNTAEIREYEENGGARGLKCYKRFQYLAQSFMKAAGDLVDTATEVVNWIPTQYSANLFEQIKIGLPVVGLFQEVSMAAATMVLPLDMNDNEAVIVSEVTDNSNADPYADALFVNPGAIASNKITLTAKKLRSRYWLSQEADEDAIVATLSILNRKHTRNFGEAIEDAIINGQPTNIDTGGTHFGKANPLAAAGTDARDLWDGIRRFTAQYTGSPASKIDNSNAKATVVGLRGMRAAMGEYGVNPATVAYLMGVFGYVKLLDDANVMTIDKFGPQATVRSGSLAQVDGVDLIVSRRIAENMNASGLIDNVTTNRTAAYAVNTEGAVIGNRRRITIGQQVHLASDSTELVAFWRGDFKPIFPVATVPAQAELFNIAAA